MATITTTTRTFDVAESANTINDWIVMNKFIELTEIVYLHSLRRKEHVTVDDLTDKKKVYVNVSHIVEIRQ